MKTGLALVQFLFTLTSTSAQLRQYSKDYDIVDGYYCESINSGLTTTYTGVKSETCEDICNADPDCAFFTYTVAEVCEFMPIDNCGNSTG